MPFKDVKHLLPPVVLEIVDIIGLERAMKLVAVIGGMSFRFSAGVKDCPRFRILIDTIGEEATQKLLERFRGSDEYIPRCQPALRALHYAQFKHDFLHMTQYNKKSARMTMLELCPKYKITERTAWKIVGDQVNATAKQQDLF